MSVSKVIRNPVGVGGDVTLAGSLTVNGDLTVGGVYHGFSVFDDTVQIDGQLNVGGHMQSNGDLSSGGNLQINGTSLFQDSVVMFAQPGHIALDVKGAAGQSIQFWRNSAGAVKAQIQSDGTLECLAGFQTGGPILVEPAIGAGLQMAYVDNNGLVQRVAGLTANQSIRVNAAGNAVEAYNTAGANTPIIIKKSGVDLAALGTTVLFTASANWITTRAVVMLESNSAPPPSFTGAASVRLTDGVVPHVTDITAVFSTGFPFNYAVLNPKVGADTIGAASDLLIEVTTAATGGAPTVCKATVYVEGFYVF